MMSAPPVSATTPTKFDLPGLKMEGGIPGLTTPSPTPLGMRLTTPSPLSLESTMRSAFSPVPMSSAIPSSYLPRPTPGAF